MGQERRRIPFPLIIYAVALVLRVVPALLSRKLGIGLDDMFQYDMLGRSLAAGDGFRWYAPTDLEMMLNALRHYIGLDTSGIALPQDPRGLLTSFRAPLYPAFLALIYWISGLQARFFAARLVQAFVMASLAPMTYYLARRLGASERHARVAAWIPAVWPMLLFFPLGLATENLFIPFLTAGTLLLFKAAERRRLRDAVLSGALLGLATLTRSVIIGFPALAAIWLWLKKMRRQAVLLVLVVAVLVVPWCVRNTLLHDKLTFLETSMGYNLYLGYHPDGDGSFIFGPSVDLITILDDAERDAEGRQRALEFIQQDPGRVPGLMLRKLGHMFGLEDRVFVYFYSNGLLGALPPWLVVAIFLLLVLPLVIVLPLSILGWVSGERGPPWQLTTLLFAWYFGIHMLIMAEERFHLAILPLLAALAGRGLTHWRALREGLREKQRWARIAAVVAGTLVLLAFLNWGLELSGNAEQLAILFGPEGSGAHFNY
jgi:ABC-type spermidine/putrescine transport system permease subunit II